MSAMLMIARLMMAIAESVSVNMGNWEIVYVMQSVITHFVSTIMAIVNKTTTPKPTITLLRLPIVEVQGEWTKLGSL